MKSTHNIDSIKQTKNPNTQADPADAVRVWWRQTSVIVRLVLCVILVLVFVYIAREVRDNKTLGFDNAVLQFMRRHETSFLDSIVPKLTDLGGIAAVITVTFISALYYLFIKRRSIVYRILAGVGGAAALNVLIKSIFERHRPTLWHQIINEQGFSFPSGHAMASSALAATFIVLFWHTKYRIIVLIVGVLYTLMIGLSRLYLGVHYPTDILAGWVVSVSWVIVVTSLLRDYSRSPATRSHAADEVES